MLQYKDWVNEKRRNPEQNPKVSGFEGLKKYIGEDNIYFSMRDLNKLGINPNSKWDTPNGIYSYNLDVYSDAIEKQKGVINVLPFQSDAPYIYVFTPTIEVLKLGELTEDWVKKFIKEVFIKYPKYKTYFIEDVKELKTLEKLLRFVYEIKSIMTEKSKMEYDDIISEIAKMLFYSDYTEYLIIEELFNLDLDKISPFKSVIIAKALKENPNNDYDSLYDRTEKIINRLTIKKEKEEERLSNSDIDAITNRAYGLGKLEAKIRNNPGGIFWWFTYFVVGNKNPNKWNAFFREMGIYGIEDEKGMGIIHRSEPFQAVFFDKTKLKVLEMIHNKEHKEVKNKFYW